MKAYLVVVAIIVCYLLATWNTNVNEKYLYGFWVADDDFCEESDIDSMLVFIGEPDRSSLGGLRSITRTCYIIITKDVANQGFTMTYRPGFSGPSVGRYVINAGVSFDGEKIWPKDVSIAIDMTTGAMTIYNNKMVYARLTKQHDVSNSCTRIEKSGE